MNWIGFTIKSWYHAHSSLFLAFAAIAGIIGGHFESEKNLGGAIFTWLISLSALMGAIMPFFPCEPSYPWHIAMLIVYLCLPLLIIFRRKKQSGEETSKKPSLKRPRMLLIVGKGAGGGLIAFITCWGVHLGLTVATIVGGIFGLIVIISWIIEGKNNKNQ